MKDYKDLVNVFRDPRSVSLDYWREIAKIERTIPRYSNRHNWYERTANFVSTYLREHTIEGEKINIAGLWTITLELNKMDDHEHFHEGKGQAYADFYDFLSQEKTELKSADSLEEGLSTYCGLNLPYNSDQMILYCRDTNTYYIVMKKLAEINVVYNSYINSNGISYIYYPAMLPDIIDIPREMPFTKEEENYILADLPAYTYIPRN